MNLHREDNDVNKQEAVIEKDTKKDWHENAKYHREDSPIKTSTEDINRVLDVVKKSREQNQSIDNKNKPK